MKQISQQFVENPPGLSYLHWLAVALAFWGLLSTNAVAARADIAAGTNPANVAEINAARLDISLQQWINSKLAADNDSTPKYAFSLGDKRLAIPTCSDFAIDPMNRIDWTTAPRALVVDIRCAEQNWQRRIRGRLVAPRKSQNAHREQQPTINVFVPRRAIKKGERIVAADFLATKALAHRTPQNAVTTISGLARYASRNLLLGRTLVESDLVIGQRVVVLTQAIPARSPVTGVSVTIEERAVDVPRDAIRSLKGLSMLAANRLLHPGDILRKRDLTKAKLVKRGQKVAVQSSGKHFRIASELIALEDGYLGEQIDLRNPGSNRRVTAFVTGMGTAQSGRRP